MVTCKNLFGLAVAGLLLGACDIVITPDRVEEGTAATVTVSNDPDAALTGVIPVCATGSTVEVFVQAEEGGPVSQGTTTAGGSGSWTLDIEAPADEGSYDVFARCADSGGNPITLDAEELIVQPGFEATADPTGYLIDDAPETITVSGPWCVSSQTEEPDPPVVTATLGDQTETVTADDNQPFGETWQLVLDAPAAVGTHTIDVTCEYVDYVSGESGGFTFDGETGTPVEVPPTFNRETVETEVLVEVTAQEETTTTAEPTTSTTPTTAAESTTTTTAAPAEQPLVEARVATAVRAEPTFTG